MKKSFDSMQSAEKPANTTSDSLPLLFDYKDPLSLYPFLDGGKISLARNNGLRRSWQRRLAKAIKKARSLSLLPSSYQAYDDFQRPAPVSPKPFDYQ